MYSEHTDLPGELKSPSQQFQAASDSVGLHWWHWDHISKKVRMSEGLAKKLGLPPEQEGYHPDAFYMNVHPEDAVRNKELLKQLYGGNVDLYEIEYRIKDPSGKWLWYYNRGTVIHKDEKGMPLVIGGISMDISGQFKRLLSIVEEQEKLEFIVHHTNEAIVVIELLDGMAGKVLDANKAAMDLFGQGREAIGKPLPDYILKDEVVGKEGILMKEVFEKGFGVAERKMKMDGGEELWLEFTLHSFTLTGENLMIAIIRDKTSGRRTEAALRESERLYQSLFEAAEDAIGLFTKKRKVVLMNSALHEVVGYTKEEYEALSLMEIVHPEDQEQLAIMEGILHREGAMATDFRVRHKEGHYLYMSSKSVMIPGEQGGDDMILTIIRDVSGLKQSMKELEEAKERAEESDMLKSAFLANMSHEIRTPMNSIIGFSNLLKSEGLEDRMRELYVSRIISNSELLLALITDIVDLAKIESGQLPIVYGRIRISELIRDMAQYAHDEIIRLQKGDLEVNTEVEIQDCEIETDVTRITQVMKNLINNAIKFTEDGKVEIGCQKGESDQMLCFYVKDTGIGISEEHFKLIFDQFRQLDGSNTRKFSGTGLGLTICKNLVHLMGGRIWVESEPGHGACFMVEHPLKAPAAGGQEVKDVRETEESREAPEKISILAVDDEPDTLELYQVLLTQMGHHVTTAHNGYEALRILEQFPLPDLVLMDFLMPVMSGTDTLNIIREHYPEVKVVAQSAQALHGDRDRFLKEGYDGYLPKPFTAMELEQLISELVESK